MVGKNQTVEEEAVTEETATATVTVVTMLEIVEKQITVNKIVHVQVPQNTAGPTGGAPTVVLSVREKQIDTSIQRWSAIRKMAAPKTAPGLENDGVGQQYNLN